MRSRTHIFFFSGVDGSGKSTHAKLLYVYAKKRGLKAQYMWFRWAPFFSYFLLFYALILRRTIKLVHSVKGRKMEFKIHVFWIDPALKKLYPRILLLDLIVRYYLLVTLYARIKRLDLVVFDRFFPDVIVDLLWESRNASLLKHIEFKVALKLININRKCGIMFLVNPLEAIKRKEDIISFKEIVFKQEIFKILADLLGLKLWDTTDAPISETFNIVRDSFHECVSS